MKPPSVQGRIGPRTLIPTCHATDLMLQNDAAIARIRMCFGIDAAAFEAQILPIIQRLADYVLNLPATKDAHYCHPGGMFEFSLEVGFFALQGTDSCIFAGRSTISVRRHLEPRWRLATFLAGLLNVLERAAGLAIVEDDTGGRWPALIAPLGPWLHARSTAGYRLGWRGDHQDAAGFGLLALPLVVPAETLQYLGEDNDDVLPALLASLAGLARYRDHSPLPKLLRRAFALVVHTRSEKADVPEEAKDRQAHLQNYLLDAMRRLAATGSFEARMRRHWKRSWRWRCSALCHCSNGCLGSCRWAWHWQSMEVPTGWCDRKSSSSTTQSCMHCSRLPRRA